jgi:hypothetical protein
MLRESHGRLLSNSCLYLPLFVIQTSFLVLQIEPLAVAPKGRNSTSVTGHFYVGFMMKIMAMEDFCTNTIFFLNSPKITDPYSFIYHPEGGKLAHSNQIKLTSYTLTFLRLGYCPLILCYPGYLLACLPDRSP